LKLSSNSSSLRGINWRLTELLSLYVAELNNLVNMCNFVAYLSKPRSVYEWPVGSKVSKRIIILELTDCRNGTATTGAAKPVCIESESTQAITNKPRNFQ